MRYTVASILCGLFVSPALYACPIPVFRYALEFWEPDAYEAEVVHRGPLSDEARAAVDRLKEYAEDEDVSVNLVLRFTDVASATPDGVADREDLPEPVAARLVVRRPANGGKRETVWDAALTLDAVEQVVDSPARREIGRRLLDGDSAVWILLEGGDRRADERCATLLLERLKVLQATLELPEALVDQAGQQALTDSKPEVRLSFSMLRVARGDAAEVFFVAALIGRARRGADVPAPVVVPVFGRGRALDPLAGDDINELSIDRAARFLVGPCSCLAKALNPGRDLLMRVDWDSELSGSLLEIIDLPPFVSVAALADAADDGETKTTPASGSIAASEVPGAATPTTAQASSQLTRNLLVALSVVVLVAALLAVRVLRQSATNNS